ncbi:UNVERIFIED_CONTAM: hypothetical protein Scaly_0470200 [Sesamum calycinum]|uniref:Uncharacterized protein n=1 Tax=Sesamum calycinum TaxID=2727403 RepID=A0AAW2SEY8_9LAMI
MYLIRRNLDVMHIEKNVFNNIFNTIMDIKGKMKDNLNGRKDLKIICNRSELEVDEPKPNTMPKAVYTHTKEHKRRICEGICGLKFSSRQSRPSKNDDLTSNEDRIQWFIFNHLGRASGASKKIWLSEPEHHIIETYMLYNYEVVTPYYE